MSILNKAHMLRFLCLSVLTLNLVSCASDAEKRERRENAFDLSGGYKTSVKNGSEVDMGFVIKNESGREDIVVELDRADSLSKKELEFLKRQNLDPQIIIKNFGKRMVLGKGYNKNQLDGGENISRDFGESSEFRVCTESLVYNEEYEVYYCLSGNAVKKDKRMTGTLSLSTMRKTKETRIVDGKEQEVQSYTSSSESLKYSLNMESIFYKQYLGSWSGDVFIVDSDFDTKPITNIFLEEANGKVSGVFAGNNRYGFKLQQIKYRDQVYVYNREESSESSESISASDYPSVFIVYNGPKNQKIMLVGQIWSLGNFTGSVVYVSNKVDFELATFRYKLN